MNLLTLVNPPQQEYHFSQVTDLKTGHTINMKCFLIKLNIKLLRNDNLGFIVSIAVGIVE